MERRFASACCDLGAAFAGAGRQVARFEHGQQLALLDMVAALHEEALNRGGDLRHHAGLVAREEDAVARDDAADGVLLDGGHLHGGRRGDLGLLLFGAAGQEQEAAG